MKNFSSVEYFTATRLTNSTRYKTRLHNVQANFGEISANVLPSRCARPEGLNKFSVEIYLELFWKLPNFTLKLTPHNLQKSSTFSSLAFLRLTGFVGVFPLDFKYSPWEVAMRAVNHQQSQTFRAKRIGSLELQVSLWLADFIRISWGDKSGQHSKNHGSLAGGIYRGFAARGGSAANCRPTGTAAAKSHSPSTQYCHLRMLGTAKDCKRMCRRT